MCIIRGHSNLCEDFQIEENYFLLCPHGNEVKVFSNIQQRKGLLDTLYSKVDLTLSSSIILYTFFLQISTGSFPYCGFNGLFF